MSTDAEKLQAYQQRLLIQQHIYKPTNILTTQADDGTLQKWVVIGNGELRKWDW